MEAEDLKKLIEGKRRWTKPLTPEETQKNLKTHNWNLNSRIGLLTAVLLALGATARATDTSTLKATYKDHFYVGVAINRSMATGTAFRQGSRPAPSRRSRPMWPPATQ